VPAVAVLHEALIRPTKLELVAAWAPGRPWWPAGDGPLERVAAYRFDDPDGEVGIEVLLVRAGAGPVVQVPLTYRGAPLAGADEALVGTADHSVLGPRWVYDGCGDPVAVRAFVAAIATGGTHAEQFLEVDGELRPYEGRGAARVRGDGAPGSAVPPVEAATPVDGPAATTVAVGGATLTVVRTPGSVDAPAGAGALTGTWDGAGQPVVLATLG
jgi:hypothetical protein